MGQYKMSELKEKVRVVMDKNMSSDVLSGLADVDTLSVDDIIADSIPRAMRYILSEAPLYMIEDNQSDGTSCVKNGTSQVSLTMSQQGDGYVGRFKLPSDFLRLVSVRMDGWKRPARVITEDDTEYYEQLSQYAGIRGNPHKPIAAIVQGPDGLYMELYSSTSKSDGIRWFRYISDPVSASTDDTELGIPEKLVASVVYMSASLSCEILGDAEHSSSLRNTSIALGKLGDG